MDIREALYVIDEMVAETAHPSSVRAKAARVLRDHIETPVTSRWWTVEQVAEHAGIAVGSVSKWCSRHGIERAHLIKASDVIRAKAAMPGPGWRRGQFKNSGTDNGKGE